MLRKNGKEKLIYPVLDQWGRHQKLKANTAMHLPVDITCIPDIPSTPETATVNHQDRETEYFQKY